MRLPDAVGGPVKAVFAVLQHVKQTGVPGLPRRERNFEAEPPIGGNRLACRPRHRDRDRAMKIPVGIDGTKPLPSLRPFGRDLPAAYDAIRLYLEDVGEIASY